MGFFEDLGNKISNTGKDIAKKTKEMSDTSKLNHEITKNQELINKTYTEIGKIYFSTYSSLDCPELKDFCNTINDANAKIEDLKKEISLIKGITTCPKCGNEVSTSAVFCGNCGSKMKEEAAEAPVENSVEVNQSNNTIENSTETAQPNNTVENQ